MGVVIGLTVAVALFVRSSLGQRVVLDEVVRRAQAELQGELHIGSMREGSLFSDPQLHAVRLTGPRARSFVEADSVQIGYSLLSALLGRVRISSVTLWGLDLVISRYPSEERTNLERIFGLGVGSNDGSEAQPMGSDRSSIRQPYLTIGSVSVRDGSLEVLRPDPVPDSRSRPAPDGSGMLSSLAVTGIALDLEDIAVTSLGSPVRATAQLADLAGDLARAGGPIRIRGAEGDIEYRPGGLTVSDASIRLPASSLTGEVTAGPSGQGGGWVIGMDLSTAGSGALSDIAWLDPRIDSGNFSGRVVLSLGSTTEIVLDGITAEVDGGSLTADGTVLLSGGGTLLDSLTVVADSLPPSRVDTWLPWSPPVGTLVAVRAGLHGPVDALRTRGTASLLDAGLATGPANSARSTDLPYPAPGPTPLRAAFAGTINLGRQPSVSGLSVSVLPSEEHWVDVFSPSLAHALDLPGLTAAEIVIDGSPSRGLDFEVQVEHEHSGIRTLASASGSALHDPSRGWGIDAGVILDSLALSIFGAGAEPLGPPLRTPVDPMPSEDVLSPDSLLDPVPSLSPSPLPRASGTILLSGRLRDAEISADLVVAGGHLSAAGVIDLMDFGSFYRLGGEVTDVGLSDIVPGLPAPAIVSGTFSIDGRGLDPSSMFATATVAMRDSRLKGIDLDTLGVSLSVSDGVMSFGDMSALFGGVSVSGDGRLGTTVPLDGEARLKLDADSLAGLRSLVHGDSVIVAKDTLSAMQATLLAFTGTDVEALPDTVDVRFSGRGGGTMFLRGSLDALDVELSAWLADGAVGRDEVDSLSVTATVRDLPGLEGAWSVSTEAWGVRWAGRSWTGLDFAGEMDRGTGTARVEIRRAPEGLANAAGRFSFGTAGVNIGIDEARLVEGDVLYELVRPATVAWGDEAISFDSVNLVRRGASPAGLTVHGALSRVGITDFTLHLSSMDLAEIGSLGKFRNWDLAGIVDLDLHAAGLSSAPHITADLNIDRPSYQTMSLSRLDGSLAYTDGITDIELDGWAGDRRVLLVAGDLPLDLSLTPVEDRIPSREMNITVEADSLPGRIALSYFRSLEDVTGSVTGIVHLGGTLDGIKPVGTVGLSDVEWILPELGIRTAPTDGILRWRPDATVDIELASQAGDLTTLGTIDLASLADPGLDLSFSFDRFLAVSRADIEATVSGAINLTGSYLRPYTQGSLAVNNVALYVEEFVRRAEIIDLSDPRLLGVDTTGFGGQPFLRDLSNPFLRNLRAEVDLLVPRDMWLRSQDMSVELGGELSVSYDRSQSDIVLMGELEALRGNYSVGQRSFDVTGGTVSFVGVPGVNPNLDIQAMTRIRRLNDDPLEMTASVRGTLTIPEIALATDEAGLGQADLFGYLLFGRPSPELAGQERLGQITGGALATFISGAAAAKLGAALARDLGIDYLSITQAGDYALVGLSNPLATTEVEIGHYVGRDAFVVLVLRPFARQVGGANFLGGVRLDVGLGDEYTLEGFFEDRFLRGGSGGLGGVGGLGGLGVSPEQIVGIFISREMGW